MPDVGLHVRSAQPTALTGRAADRTGFSRWRMHIKKAGLAGRGYPGDFRGPCRGSTAAGMLNCRKIMEMEDTQ